MVLGGSASPRPPPSAELLTVTPSPPLPLGVAAEPPPFQLHRVTSWRQEMAANGTSAVEIEVEGLDGSRCWLSLHEALRLAVTAAQRGEEDGGWNCAGCPAKGWSNSAVLCCLKCGAPSIIPEAQCGRGSIAAVSAKPLKFSLFATSLRTVLASLSVSELNPCLPSFRRRQRHSVENHNALL